MKDIKECAELYKSLLNKNYIFTLENGITFTIYFQPSHFFHLIGLHKLNDLEKLTENSKSIVFKKILRGQITQAYIEKSLHYRSMSNRIQYFEEIANMLDKENSKVIVDFDHSKLTFESELNNTKYILYRRVKDGCAHTTIGKEKRELYPETFFFDESKRYLTGQTLLDIIKIETVIKK